MDITSRTWALCQERGNIWDCAVIWFALKIWHEMQKGIFLELIWFLGVFSPQIPSIDDVEESLQITWLLICFGSRKDEMLLCPRCQDRIEVISGNRGGYSLQATRFKACCVRFLFRLDGPIQPDLDGQVHRSPEATVFYGLCGVLRLCLFF